MAFYIFLGFTILWFLFMTYLSHQDGEHTGRTSRELAEKLSALDFLDSDINILNGRLRRLAHVVVYHSALRREMLHYSMPLVPSTLNWWVMGASNRYVIRFFIDNAANGIFAVANKFPSILSTIFFDV